MNILVSPYGEGSFYFRSDSTLIRALTDFYMPDYIEGISAVPALCFRSLRSGKAVPARFASRYLGPFSCCLLLKARINPAMVAAADTAYVENALDYSTVIPYDLLPYGHLNGFMSAGRPLSVKINGLEKISVTSIPDMDSLSRRFETICGYCSLRTGDFITFELSEAVPVPRGSKVTVTFGTEGRISVIIH